MSETVQPAARSASVAENKSVKTTYLLWLTAGFFGAHRWYLGRWATALTYFVMLMLVMTGGLVLELVALLGIALLIDAALIPKMVRKRNEELAVEFEEHPERFVVLEHDDTLAPWAQNPRTGIAYKLSTPIRIFAFVALPASAATLAVQFQTYELVVFPMVILLATGLVGSLDQIAARYPALAEIPGLDAALGRVKELRLYYWENEPRVWQSFMGVFKKNLPYWKIILVVLFAVAIETVVSYASNYPPYLDPSNAVEAFFVLGITASIGVLINLVPLTVLSFRYSLSGKRNRLRVLTVAALMASAVGFVTAHQLEKDDDVPSLMSGIRLEMRMTKPDFREDLKKKISAFLTYYTHFESDNYTKQLRESLAGIAKNDEIDAFEFLYGEYFLGVAYKAEGGPCSLYVENSSANVTDNVNQSGKWVSYYMLSLADSNGVVYHDFNEEIPEVIRQEFQESVEYGLPTACHKLIDNSFDETQT